MADNRIGIRRADRTPVELGDTLFAYGRDQAISQVPGRPRGPLGQQAHGAAVAAETARQEAE